MSAGVGTVSSPVGRRMPSCVEKTPKARSWIFETTKSRPRLLSRRVLASGLRKSVRKSPIALLSGLLASSLPSSGSLRPKIWPWRASWRVWRNMSSPSTTIEGSASRAKMLGRLGLKLLQSGVAVTRNVKASAGLEKSLLPSMPILTPSTFWPLIPAPLKTGSLIGSWKLSVPTKSGSRTQASGEGLTGQVAGGPVAVPARLIELSPMKSRMLPRSEVTPSPPNPTNTRRPLLCGSSRLRSRLAPMLALPSLTYRPKGPIRATKVRFDTEAKASTWRLVPVGPVLTKKARFPLRLPSSISSWATSRFASATWKVIVKVCGLPAVTTPELDATRTFPAPMLGSASSAAWMAAARAVESAFQAMSEVVWFVLFAAAGGVALVPLLEPSSVKVVPGAAK